MSSAPIIRRLTLDLVAWYCLPLVFLTIYVGHYSFSPEALGPHLRLAFLPLLLLTVTRIVLARFVPSQMVAQIAAGGVAALLLLLMLSYYALVLIGLESWGQVISWALIKSYAIQAPGLADSLGISMALTAVVLCLAYLALSACAWLYVKRFDWPSPLVAAIPLRMVILIAIAGPVFIAIEMLAVSMTGGNAHGEPIALTIFPQQTSRRFESHLIDHRTADKADLLEDHARTNYAINEHADSKNIILIVVDALRPSRMGIYGYARNTTPNLGALKRGGQLRVISGARSSCGESACGLFSLATSKYVHQFSSRPFTLYQVLHKHRYAIHMILGGDHTNFYGLKNLYAEADSYFDATDAKHFYANDDQLVLDKVNTLASWDGKPVAMQFHLMSAHTLGKRMPDALKFLPAANYMLPQNRSAKDKVDNYYDNGVVQADLVIHGVLEALNKKGYLKNALVVITADHGEALGEHGLYAHANGVREEIIRVPLALISYGYESVPIAARNNDATLIDVAPTILFELGMPIPETWTGVPLQQPSNRDFTFYMQGSEVGLLDHRDPHNLWKYWINQKTGAQFVFNLDRDAAEEFNVLGTAPAVLKQEWITKLIAVPPVGVAPTELDSLESAKHQAIQQHTSSL